MTPLLTHHAPSLALQVLSASPSAFLAYVEVLTALAAGERGARSMFAQLRAENSFMVVSWRRMFEILHTIIR